LNRNFLQFQSLVSEKLFHGSLHTAALKQQFYSMVDTVVNRQAAMMAYNDASWILGILFLIIMPLILMLPGHAKINQFSEK